MPRKSRPNPPVLKVESLSDGRSVAAPLIDDFTGEAIMPVGAPMPKAMRSAQEIIDEGHRAKATVAAQLLTSVGILKPKAESPQDGRLSLPSARPCTDRLAYHKRKWNRVVVKGEATVAQPAIPRPVTVPAGVRSEGSGCTLITLKTTEWRRI